MGRDRPPSFRSEGKDIETQQHTVQAGRPRMPLADDVARDIVRLYTDHKHSQAIIAQLLGIAITRVRRHLIEEGLYTPRPATRTEARAEQFHGAVEAYIEGDKVVDICQTFSVNPAALYQELRRCGVPYRTQKEVHDV